MGGGSGEERGLGEGGQAGVGGELVVRTRQVGGGGRGTSGATQHPGRHQQQEDEQHSRQGHSGNQEADQLGVRARGLLLPLLLPALLLQRQDVQVELVAEHGPVGGVPH